MLNHLMIKYYAVYKSRQVTYFVQVRYFPAAENIVNVFKKNFLDDLGVVEQEGGRLILHSGLIVESLQVCNSETIGSLGSGIIKGTTVLRKTFLRTLKQFLE